MYPLSWTMLCWKTSTRLRCRLQCVTVWWTKCVNQRLVNFNVWTCNVIYAPLWCTLSLSLSLSRADPEEELLRALLGTSLLVCLNWGVKWSTLDLGGLTRRLPTARRSPAGEWWADGCEGGRDAARGSQLIYLSTTWYNFWGCRTY
jgi:hypothetical protein